MLLPVIEGCVLHVSYNLYIPETNLSTSKNILHVGDFTVQKTNKHVMYFSVNGKIGNESYLFSFVLIPLSIFSWLRTLGKSDRTVELILFIPNGSLKLVLKVISSFVSLTH